MPCYAVANQSYVCNFFSEFSLTADQPTSHTYGDVGRALLADNDKESLFFRNLGLISKRATHIGHEVWIADPADVAAVIRAEPKYPKRFKNPLFDDFYQRHAKDPGVFFLNDAKWQKQKRIISKKMLRPPQINQYIPRINDVATEMITRIYQVRNDAGSDRSFEVDEIDMELFKWSFETVTDFLFDRRFGSLEKNPPPDSVAFIKAVGNFLDNVIAASLVPLKFYKYYKTKAFKAFDENFMLLYQYAEKLIAEKLDDIERREALGENLEDSQELIPFLLSSKQITNDEVGSSIVDTLFAGVDTTSNTMQWMLYLLAKHPDVQNRVREEVMHVFPEGTDPNVANLQCIPLLKATIKETLRLFPVLIVTGRVLPTDIVLSGYHIPANTSMMFLNHSMGRSEELFEDALAFKPERWLRDDSGDLPVDAFASLPFGFGVRMCLGRRLAELELQILLIKILRKFQLELPAGHIVGNYFRGTNIPDKPIRVKFMDRN